MAMTFIEVHNSLSLRTYFVIHATNMCYICSSDEKEERAILTSTEDDGPNGAPVIPPLSVSKKPLLRDIHPFTAASNHTKKLYPKLFEIDDTNTYVVLYILKFNHTCIVV